MNRELKIFCSVLAVTSGLATIICAEWWVCWLCCLILGFLVAYLLFLHLRHSQPLPDISEFTHAPYTVSPAEISDIHWAAEAAKKVYTGIDIIPCKLMLEWFKANPKGFYVVKDRHGHRCGNIDILPLRPDTLTRLIEGEIIERDIRGDCLLSPADTGNITDIYVESVVAVNNKYQGNPYAALRIILSVPTMLNQLCPQNKLSRVYAIGGSKRGIKLMRHLGFDMISRGNDRKDKHKLFSVAMNDLLENISEFTENTEEKERFFRLISDKKGEGNRTL